MRHEAPALSVADDPDAQGPLPLHQAVDYARTVMGWSRGPLPDDIDVVLDNQLHCFLLKGITARQLYDAPIKFGGHSKCGQNAAIVIAGTVDHFQPVYPVNEGRFAIQFVQDGSVCSFFTFQRFNDFVQIERYRCIRAFRGVDNTVRCRCGRRGFR